MSMKTYLILIINIRVICAEELMSVMICLGNPRTMEEIKVNSSINPSMIVIIMIMIMMMIIIRSSRVLKGHLGPSKAFQGLQWPSRPSRAFNGLPVPSKAFKGLPWPFKSLPGPPNIQMCLKQKKLTQHFQEMIAEEDPDGDGIVTKEEFTKMLERKK